MNDLVLAKLGTARTALAEAKTIQETKHILDVATAAEIYAKRQQLGEEAILYATSIKVEALRQLGNMLKETPRNTGTRLAGSTDGLGGAIVEPPSTTPTLAELGLNKKISKLAQDIAELPDEQIEAVMSGVVSISKAIEKTKHPHVSNNSGNNEWYTPSEYIEAARQVMGEIDLDPASSKLANETVKAITYFTADDDGLLYHWSGNVFMNPPYSSDMIGKFAWKLADHIVKGDVIQAVVLVNNATETAWFGELINIATAIVFPHGRIKFVDSEGNPTGTPLQGQAIIYAGDNPDIFLEVFLSFGWGAKL